ncbi:MAG: zinc-ribbon domain-containing protein [Acidobacteriota bacterium]
MADVTFRCPSCGKSFTLPEGALPAQGARGRCTSCGAQLVVHPDGRAQLLGLPPPPKAAPGVELTGPAADFRWEVRSQRADGAATAGPHTLAELREMILTETLFEGDYARVEGGDWQPVRAYPALMGFFAELVELHRQRHGDEEHCAEHRDREPDWRCPRCKNYLCRDCVKNQPLIEGGSPRYLCAACGIEAEPLKRGSLRKMVPGLFKKG